MTPGRKSEAALVLALARGETIAAASRSSGYSRPPIYKRLADPAVMVEVRAIRRRIFQRTVGLLVDASAEAAGVLSELHSSIGAEGDQVRLRAAVETLKLARDWLRVEDLESRLTVVERRLIEKDTMRSNGRDH